MKDDPNVVKCGTIEKNWFFKTILKLKKKIRQKNYKLRDTFISLAQLSTVRKHFEYKWALGSITHRTNVKGLSYLKVWNNCVFISLFYLICDHVSLTLIAPTGERKFCQNTIHSEQIWQLPCNVPCTGGLVHTSDTRRQKAAVAASNLERHQKMASTAWIPKSFLLLF